MLAFMMASCDDHAPVDLDIHIGYILCEDGRMLSEADFVKSGQEGVAVVFAEKTDDHPVLAVMLEEIPFVAFADTLSFDQKTSCDVAAFDGYENTVALQTSHLDRPALVDSTYLASAANYYVSPLGLLAFSSHYYFQSDFVPSVSEMGLLFLRRDEVNKVIERLGGTPLSTQNDGFSCWYWTSTEVEGNSLNQAWLVSMADGSRHKAPKTNCYNARFIVEYNPLDVKH